MVREPKLCDETTTVEEVRRLFDDTHVHAAVVTRGDLLLALVERTDLHETTSPSRPAWLMGRLQGRTVSAEADVEHTRLGMIAKGRRRLAVVDDGVFCGLLCLSRTGKFCTDAGIAARAVEKAAMPRRRPTTEDRV